MIRNQNYIQLNLLASGHMGRSTELTRFYLEWFSISVDVHLPLALDIISGTIKDTRFQ